MTEGNRFQSGSAHSHSTAYTSGVSCGTTETNSTTHTRSGRACAAVVVQEITLLLEELAADVPTRDFVWARLAIDTCFDDILFGHQPG
jgi:hypothetical protein